MGEDQENTRKVLMDYIGAYDPERVKFLQCQDYEDEMEAAMELLGQLYEKAGFYDLAIFTAGSHIVVWKRRHRDFGSECRRKD